MNQIENMQDNKYYTPELNEFRVGFEYQSKNNAKEEFYTYHVEKDFDSCVYQYLIDRQEVRVKRLNCDDIVECGFEYDKYCNRYLKDSIISVTLINGIVHIKDRSWKDDDTVDDTLFIGTIKNKSELIMILKMIGAWNQ